MPMRRTGAGPGACGDGCRVVGSGQPIFVAHRRSDGASACSGRAAGDRPAACLGAHPTEGGLHVGWDRGPATWCCSGRPARARVRAATGWRSVAPSIRRWPAWWNSFRARSKRRSRSWWRGSDRARRRAMISSRTALASTMLVNNETGVVQPLDAVHAAAGASGPGCTPTPVQAFPVTFRSTSPPWAWTMTVTAHKLGGPVGNRGAGGPARSGARLHRVRRRTGA